MREAFGVYFSFQVKGSHSLEEQRFFGEVDDQYGTCDLRTADVGGSASGEARGI